MSEGYTYSPFEKFDHAPLQEALGAEPQPTLDVLLGQGQAVELEGNATLEVFPDSRVARVTTEHARLELRHVPGVLAHESGKVIFEVETDHERTRLAVRRDGEVLLQPFKKPTEPAQTSQRPPTPPIEDATPHSASQGATQRPETNDLPTSESEERTVITLTGRLGRDPWFKRDEDELRSGFPLAVNHHDGTIWHNVVARGDVATEVENGQKDGYVRKGREVVVTGSHAEPTGKGKPPFEATAVTRPARRQTNSRRAD